MKLIYIHTSRVPSQNANSVHVMKMCQAFAKNGHDVELLIPEYKNLDKSINIYSFYNVEKNFKTSYIKWSNKKGKTLFWAYNLLKYIKKEKPDLVYGRFLFGCTLSALFGFKTIFETHAPITENGIIEKLFFKFINKLNKLKKIVVITNSLKKYYLEKENINEKKILVSHDGADEVKDLKNKKILMGIPNKLKIGYVGSFHKGKGIEVIEKLINKNENVEFHILGGSAEEVESLQKRVKRDSLFLYGYKSQNEISHYINAFDICLLPNQKIVYGANATSNNSQNIANYTSPLKMFEYMAHKKPIIASNLLVLKEVLDDTNSILVDSENSDEWIRAIEQLKDQTIRDSIAHRAYEDFIKNYTWIQRAKKIMDSI